MSMKNSTANRAFTLIETMVAISILTLAMAGPLFTASRAIVAAQTARDQLTASYLAQEGIEYVRAMRDNEYLSAFRTGGTNIAGAAWDNFLGGTDSSSITRCIAPAVCTLDSASLDALGNGSLTPCAGNSCASQPLYITNCTNGSRGLVCTPPNIYTEQNLPGSVKTPFVRTVQAIPISANEEKVVSTVSWNFHGTPYSVTVSDHFTAWQ